MKNRNLSRVFFPSLERLDGTVAYLPVDQFPVSNKGIFKDDGFPMSDIGILDRLSMDVNVDQDFVRAVAARCEKLSDVPDNGLTLSQEIKALRPAWCQTASEYKVYSEHVYQVLSAEKKEVVKTDPEKTDTTDEVKSDVVVDSAPAAVE